MPEIKLLSQETIDKIAAGEVVERPSSVVKELVENAIDAGATAVTVEIKEGGTSFIRITDNGCGIAHDQVPIAFLRHSTSKIRSAEDLVSVSSLGFRGEALSSIAAVSRVELITKTRDELTGTRYQIEGSKEISCDEIGAPEGTTFLVRDLFYNTPARRKFLKTPHTEGIYVSDIVEKLALSHPEVSFKFILNNQSRLHTSGNGNCKDLIYHIFGREIAASLFPVDFSNDYFSVTGFIGKPLITRGNRNYEIYFINGRFVRSNLLSKGIEDAYKKFLMQHQYPFTVLYFTFHDDLDVNVHPQKMELRFGNTNEVYTELCNGLYAILSHKEMIFDVPVHEEKHSSSAPREIPAETPEPFEERRLNDIRRAVAKDSPYEIKFPDRQQKPQNGSLYRPETAKTAAASNTSEPSEKTADAPLKAQETSQKPQEVPAKPEVVSLGKVSKASATYDPLTFLDAVSSSSPDPAARIASVIQEIASPAEHSQETSSPSAANASKEPLISSAGQGPSMPYPSGQGKQISLGEYQPQFLTRDGRRRHRIIGQLFKTYWLVEFEDKLFIIDQHAAHEKVLYERTMKKLKDKEFTSQMISPPLVMSLDARESEMLEKYRPQIERLGYEVEHFGGKDYMITAVPDNLFHIDMKDLFIEMLDDFTDFTGRETPDLIMEKVASMSCKAAVKGNDALSLREIQALFDELLELENPYNCPHGRPTIISMTKYEIEKKFKRII